MTPAEKARVIVEIAEWLVEDFKDGLGTAAQAKAIDAAYTALQTHKEPAARNEICAFLLTGAKSLQAHPARHEQVRALIRAVLNRNQYGIDRTQGEASDQSIDIALEAWHTTSSTRWAALATVLTESGFTPVAPDSLRVDWERRTKRTRPSTP
ncbi:MAG TPA: hypothetical protein VK745_23120 [Polyangiaceae bacterium]|nr:hypothetical protein [Polyangiaceae bacterium]